MLRVGSILTLRNIISFGESGELWVSIADLIWELCSSLLLVVSEDGLDWWWCEVPFLSLELVLSSSVAHNLGLKCKSVLDQPNYEV